jgi:hypothetical protein
MKNNILKMLSLCILSIPCSIFADSFGNEDTAVLGFIDAGISFGGDTVLKSEDFNDIKAGEGFHVAAGLQYTLPNIPISVHSSIGAHSAGIFDETFSRIPIEIGASYKRNNMRFGLAFAKQTNVTLENEDFKADLKDANASIFEIGIKPDFIKNLWALARYTKTEYQGKFGGPKINGDSIGFHIQANHSLF